MAWRRTEKKLWRVFSNDNYILAIFENIYNDNYVFNIINTALSLNGTYLFLYNFV